MKHDFFLDEDGFIDNWRMDAGFHNGPECMRCGAMACHHCDKDFEDEECPSGQLDLFEE